MTAEKKPNPLRQAVHVLAPMPLVALVIAYFTGNLTVNPIQAATQRAGDIAIIILLLELACTPVNTLFDIPMVLKLRRPLGLWAFYYACLHMLTYVGLDYGFDFDLFRLDHVNKPYILFGFITLLILSALAFTSRKWWKRKLGKNWKRLHKLVYAAGVMAVIHLALVVKGDFPALRGDIWKPLTAGVVLIFLLVLRIPAVKSSILARRQKNRAAAAARAALRQPAPAGVDPAVGIEEPKLQP